EKYGLDKPIHIQLVAYLKNVLRGDFENSILYGEPVTKLLWDTMGPSLLLALTGTILALFIGTMLGLYAARHQNSIIDVFFSGISYLLNSMPSFWLAIMLIMIFATNLKLFPTSGMTDMRNSYTGIKYVLDVIKHLFLPCLTLVLIQIPMYFKIAKSSVTQVLAEDFITTFRAVGMNEKKIFNKYVFKNAILPVITVFGINLAYIVTGSSLVEMVFGWPGMGRMMMDSIMRRDYPLLMAIYLILSLSIAVMMVITDLVYAYVDPRIRYNN
ncbi:MAG TPA: ABC transporter permease, partial [Clostridiales bacterium]|nr:ABC transporter permease [Clostridiales bacterium]